MKEPAVEIGFNAQYLLDFLRAVQEPQVAFLFKDPHSAGELRPAGETARATIATSSCR